MKKYKLGRWRGKKVRCGRCVAKWGEDRRPIVPAYSSTQRPKINICSKKWQHKFIFWRDQSCLEYGDKVSKYFKNIVVLRWLMKVPENQGLELNNDISFDDNLSDQAILLSSICWDVPRILLKVRPSSRLTCQLDRVVCWPELTGSWQARQVDNVDNLTSISRTLPP